jgi:hypothetical protein
MVDEAVFARSMDARFPVPSGSSSSNTWQCGEARRHQWVGLGPVLCFLLTRFSSSTPTMTTVAVRDPLVVVELINERGCVYSKAGDGQGG